MLVRQPGRSEIVQLPRTNDSQLPLQPQQVVHAVEDPSIQSTCAPSAFVQPSMRLHLLWRVPVWEHHHGAARTPMWCLLPPGPLLVMAVRPPPPQSANILRVGCWHIHIADHEIRACSPSCFSADAHPDALEGKSTSAQHTRLCTSCPVATRVKWLATSATSHQER